jgi:hypothetical protein
MGGKTTSKATVLRYVGSTRSKIFGLADGKNRQYGQNIGAIEQGL